MTLHMHIFGDYFRNAMNRSMNVNYDFLLIIRADARIRQIHCEEELL